MKPVPSSQKLRGGYYTPEPIARFLARWAVQTPTADILEPSCGDGVLIEAAVEALSALGASKADTAQQIHGIEIDEVEAQKARERLCALDIPASPSQIYSGDFFAYCKEHLLIDKFMNTVVSEGRQFDSIIGNPPFIRFQNFPEAQSAIAFKIMREARLKPTKLTNSWVPFLVASSFLLKKEGRLAMVIPAELLQVNYAAEIRLFLSNFFANITLLTFRKLIFDSIQQEVVLLLCERGKTEGSGINVVELDRIEDLETYEHKLFSSENIKPIEHTTDKWTQYYLDKKEILFLRSLKDHPSLSVTGDVLRAEVGVVTGDNNFFILTEQQVRENSLEAYVQPVATRSSQLEGTIFDEVDWNRVSARQAPAYLFLPNNQPFEELPEVVKRYVIKGEEKGVNKGFKCSERKPWYWVPSVWPPDAFMLRQVHNYPKIVYNQAGFSCTDTIHRVRFSPGVDGKVVTGAFLNQRSGKSL